MSKVKILERVDMIRMFYNFTTSVTLTEVNFSNKVGTVSSAISSILHDLEIIADELRCNNTDTNIISSKTEFINTLDAAMFLVEKLNRRAFFTKDPIIKERLRIVIPDLKGLIKYINDNNLG